MMSDVSHAEIIDSICQLFRRRGSSMYAGEPVTQTEHALQTALQAEQQGASAALIAAALLHDVGHLLHDLGEDCAVAGIDDRHEQAGADWLSRFFPHDVVEPIRLHVPAKRYLCAVDEKYRSQLSEASALSLQLQGGPFSPEEVAAFRETPHFEAALTLRGWDESAKIAGLATPDVNHFRPYLKAALGD